MLIEMLVDILDLYMSPSSYNMFTWIILAEREILATCFHVCSRSISEIERLSE